jgi:hypothetical protein
MDSAPCASRRSREIAMSQTIYAKLVRYRHDGKYLGAPVTLEGSIVDDEEHGCVLEIALPASTETGFESAIFVSVTELQKLK